MSKSTGQTYKATPINIVFAGTRGAGDPTYIYIYLSLYIYIYIYIYIYPSGGGGFRAGL